MVSGQMRKISQYLNTPNQLLDLAVQGHFAEHRVELFEFETARCVLFVLLGNVTRRARLARSLMFGAFQNDEEAVAFALFSHFFENFAGLAPLF